MSIYNEAAKFEIPDGLRESMSGLEVPDPVNETWIKEHGTCKGADPTIFYGPETPGGIVTELKPARKLRIAQAKEICDACPAEPVCLEFALANSQTRLSIGRIGIWGGKTPRQRSYILSRRRAIEQSRTKHPSYMPDTEQFPDDA